MLFLKKTVCEEKIAFWPFFWNVDSSWSNKNENFISQAPPTFTGPTIFSGLGPCPLLSLLAFVTLFVAWSGEGVEHFLVKIFQMKFFLDNCMHFLFLFLQFSCVCVLPIACIFVSVQVPFVIFHVHVLFPFAAFRFLCPVPLRKKESNAGRGKKETVIKY